MVEIPVKIDAPLSRENVLSLNQRRVQAALDRQNVGELNRPAPAPNGAPGRGGPYPPAPQPAWNQPPQPYAPPQPAWNQPPQPYAPPQPARNQPPQPYTPPQPAWNQPPQPYAPPQPARNQPPQPQTPAAPPAQVLPRMEPPLLSHPARKGQKLPLESGGKLRKLKVCFGWNLSNAACEVDASAFLLRDGRVLGDEWFVFYGQESSPDGSTAFTADAAPDRERITVDFQRLNPAVDRIAFILTINEALENNLNFSMIRDAYVRLIDGVSDQELVSFRIEEYYPNVISMTIGEVYLHNGTWKFSAVGNGVGKDLAGLCQLYGVQTE